MLLRKMAYGLILLFCIGCSEGELASVSGSVTFAGKEVPHGTLRFFPIEGTPGNGAGAEIKDGRFEIAEEIAQEKGMMAGKYRVSVSASRKTGRKRRNPEGDGSMMEEVKSYIPEKYNLRSGLIVELQSGTNEHDLSLVP